MLAGRLPVSEIPLLRRTRHELPARHYIVFSEPRTVVWRVLPSAMPRTRIDEQGQVVEIPPEVLDCGCVYGPRVAVLGYNPHPSGVGRCRTYWCRTCRVMTYSEPDDGRGAAAIGR